MDTYYTAEQAYQTVEDLVAAGWEFKSYSYTPQVKGWWVKDDGDPVHGMRRGDPKPFYDGAMATAQLYLEQDAA